MPPKKNINEIIEKPKKTKKIVDTTDEVIEKPKKTKKVVDTTDEVIEKPKRTKKVVDTTEEVIEKPKKKVKESRENEFSKIIEEKKARWVEVTIKINELNQQRDELERLKQEIVSDLARCMDLDDKKINIIENKNIKKTDNNDKETIINPKKLFIKNNSDSESEEDSDEDSDEERPSLHIKKEKILKKINYNSDDE